MRAFGKWQTAAQPHECGDCVDPVLPGERYMRIVVVQDEAMERIEGAVVIADVPAAVQEHVARQRSPVLKYHETCWHLASTRRRPRLERTILRGDGEG